MMTTIPSLTPMLVLHEVLSLALIYSIFCRAVRADRRVRIELRLSMWALWMSAVASALAPFQGIDVDTLHIVFLLALCALHLATARYWRHGVPPLFIKPECRGYRRRAEDQA